MRRTVMFAALIVLLIATSVTGTGCWKKGDSTPTSGVIEFSTPDEDSLPPAVKAKVGSIKQDGGEQAVLDGDTYYVLVARGEVPHPGHGVHIDGISYQKNGESILVQVQASYTKPDPDKMYPQVISYPVAVASFAKDKLPSGVVVFDFAVDSSAVVEEKETISVTLFYGTQDGYMTSVMRALQTEEVTVDILLAELLLGPMDESLVPVLPEGTQILNVTRDEDDPSLVTVDLSSEARQVQGSLGEMLAVYSIVNTLAANDQLGIERVQITVEGSTVESLNGHLDLTVPHTYNEDLLVTGK